MVSQLIPIILICIPILAGAEQPVAEEYQVKGAFLLNFTKFVNWPPQAFKGPGEPITICVLGENPFGPALEQAAKETVVGNRRIAVREVSDSQQASQCQVVFLGGSERKRLRKWLGSLEGTNVLTVGESEDFLANGGVIAFKLGGDLVRIEISTAAADRAGLQISSKLLSLANRDKNSLTKGIH